MNVFTGGFGSRKVGRVVRPLVIESSVPGVEVAESLLARIVIATTFLSHSF